MADPLFRRAPDSGFDDPLGLLQACHERVERMLRLLGRLGEHLAQVGCDEQAGQAARDIMRYFDQAAPAHHEDEERHVLPALRALGGEHAELADRLHADHQAMAVSWAMLRADLMALIEGRARTADLADRSSAWEPFARSYREHIALEESKAYPPTLSTLDAPMQARIGAEMAQRRGVRPVN